MIIPDFIRKANKSTVNMMSAAIICLFTITRYLVELNNSIAYNKGLNNFLSIVFFVVYTYFIFCAIKKNGDDGVIGREFGINWFSGFRLIVIVTLFNVITAYIMEIIFPSIRIESLKNQLFWLQKELKDKSKVGEYFEEFKKKYLFLKLSMSMFQMLFLGLLLNTLVCLLIKIYYSRELIKRK